MVELQSLTNILWYDDFIGIGYRYHDIYMNVFPIFEDRSYASKLWDKTIHWWPDDEIRLRFVEQEEDKKNNYWFILYKTAQHMDDKENPRKSKRGSDNKKFDLVLLKKNKTVYDIQFMSFSNLSSDSTEMSYIVNAEK